MRFVGRAGRVLLTAAAAACASAGGGAHGTPGPQGAAAVAARAPAGDIIIRSASAKWPQLAPHFEPPQYPADARARGIQTRVVVAFVIGRSGAVERPTISIIQPGWSPEFNDAVCEFLARARFTWGDHEPARTLVLMPFDFSIKSAQSEPLPKQNLKPIDDMLRTFSQAQLQAWIAGKPHCAMGATSPPDSTRAQLEAMGYSLEVDEA